MSASTQTAPRQLSFGRFPAALAMLALVVILAFAVAIVALNGTKAAAPATSGAKGAPPPAVIDHGSRGEMPAPITVHNYGGWGGAVPPVLNRGDNSKDDQNTINRNPYTDGAPNGLRPRAQ